MCGVQCWHGLGSGYCHEVKALGQCSRLESSLLGEDVFARIELIVEGAKVIVRELENLLDGFVDEVGE